MQTCLRLWNQTIPIYLNKTLIEPIQFMAMFRKSYLMIYQILIGKSVGTTTTVDASLNHSLATGRSLTGWLHFVNHTPIQKGKQQWNNC